MENSYSSSREPRTQKFAAVPEVVLPFRMHPQTDPDHSITSVEYFARSRGKTVIFALLTLLTGGFMALFAWWMLRLRVWMLYVKVNPKDATRLVIKTLYDEEEVPVHLTPEGNLRFYFRFMPFYIEDNTIAPFFFDSSLPYSTLLSKAPLTDVDAVIHKAQFGACQIIVPIKSIPILLIQEIMHPFFVFQIFSCILWFVEEYTWYAIAIVIINAISLTTNLVSTRANLRKIAGMVYSRGTVKVLRGPDNQVKEIDQADLVPGDLMFIGNQKHMSCDAILLSGNCVMEEGMLTGESVPVMKDSLPNIDHCYDIEKDKRFSLYEGTKVIQTRGPHGEALALVVRTGYQTLKGKLVRTILYPKPTKFKFYRDSMLFILALGITSIIGFIIVVPSFVKQGNDASEIVIRSLDLVTISIPPALPTAMVAGISFALYRLSKQGIFCIAPHRINAAGKISTMIFDKTGTLTEDGMDFIGVLQGPDFSELNLKPTNKIQENMASCHSLAVIEGVVRGETQDLRIYEATGAELVANEYDPSANTKIRLKASDNSMEQTGTNTPLELEVLKIFYFTSELKRMGVLVKSQDLSELHLKGAPEVIKPLCRAETVPSNFEALLAMYTQQGFRVLASACRSLDDPLEINKLELSHIETELTFLGFIILQNKLKAMTIPTLSILREADIVVKMATGDNVLTGVAVGKECSLIRDDFDLYVCELDNGQPAIASYLQDEISSAKSKPRAQEIPWRNRPGFVIKSGVKQPVFAIAMTGEFFAKAVSDDSKELVDDLILNGCVFARMAPEHKSLLIEQLQARNKLVGMCGDGANDCGALKTADIGISLCEAEASIAAPFTSKIADISCIPIVLREGRCSLAISLQEFKFMALYSMCQFVSVLILYWYGINLTDIQFLIEDLFIVLPLAIFLGYTGPRQELSKARPVGCLISVSVLLSVVVQTSLIVITQAISLEMCKHRSFYHEVDIEDEPDDALVSDLYYKWENSAVFVVGIFQLVGLNYLLSISKPFKRPPYTNLMLTGWVILWTAIVLWLMIWPIDLLRWIFVVKPFPGDFRGYMLALCFAYFIVAYVFERFVVPWLHNFHKGWKRGRKYGAFSGSVSIS